MCSNACDLAALSDAVQTGTLGVLYVSCSVIYDCSNVCSNVSSNVCDLAASSGEERKLEPLVSCRCVLLSNVEIYVYVHVYLYI